MDSLCRVRNKIIYVLSRRTVSALTRVLFCCLFPSSLRYSGNKHKNDPLVTSRQRWNSSSLEYIHHSLFMMSEVIWWACACVNLMSTYYVVLWSLQGNMYVLSSLIERATYSGGHLGGILWYPIMLCSLLDDLVSVDRIHWYPVCKWVLVTWIKGSGTNVVVLPTWPSGWFALLVSLSVLLCIVNLLALYFSHVKMSRFSCGIYHMNV